MQIFKYGIVLTSLTINELEVVRNWRNSDDVRPYMQYQKMISSRMQLEWFNSLNRISNLYFVIQKEGEKIGLINLKDINWKSRTAEAGIFVGNRNYINSMIPVLATVTLMEFAFDVLKLIGLKAKIGVTNNKVIQFNESIGYQENETQSNEEFHYYRVNANQFYAATAKMRETLRKLNANRFEIVLSEIEKEELNINEEAIAIPELKLTICN